jgi:hypothetical protein
MSTPDSTQPDARRPSVFLSYASEDRPAAQTLRDALASFGLEVLYDESSLVGGDAWDQKIRRQIRDCDYFMPLISASTAARAEGYFRREWRLAVERTLDMADDHVFLLPIVIDETSETRARVPDKFLAVQWLRLPGGKPSAALEELCRRLLSGEAIPGMRTAGGAPEERQASRKPSHSRSRPSPPPAQYPPFPREEPGQRTRFWLQVLGWTLRWAWISFKRVPKTVRVLIYIWVAIALIAQWNSHGSHGSHEEHSKGISAADAQKLKAISEAYQGGTSKPDLARLAQQIARQFSDDSDQATADSPVLAIPFSAPAGDAAAAKLADATFAQVYGRVAIAHHGHVGLAGEAPASLDAAGAAEQGRAHHAKWVVYGAVDHPPPAESLSVSIVAVPDGDAEWSKSYPIAGADPAEIAAEVASELSKAEED